jgi:long-chain acyl-CoA synthetase
VILDKVLHNAVLFPEKEAIVYGEHVLTYASLAKEIELFTTSLKSHDKTYKLFNQNPIKTIIELLALNGLNKRCLVLPTEHSLDDILDENNSIENAFIGILTSGSTGKEKVIWKTNDNWELAFKHQSNVFGITKEDKVFVMDALAYSANLNAALHILWEGGTLVLGSLKNARNWDKVFHKHQVSSCFLVPSHCKLLNTLNVKNLKSIVTAGEKLKADTAQRLLEQFPNVTLTEYYGAAELGHISYHQNNDIIAFPHSVGKAFPDVQIWVVVEKVTVDSPYISPSYKDIGTVNDLGYFEKDRLVLKGRAGRIFNRRAVNIYAQEIEDVVLKLSSIREAVLLKHGQKDKLCLYFTSKHRSDNIEAELNTFLKANLPSAKWPNFVKEINEIPHSEAGKVDFRALSKMSEEEEEMFI